MGKGAGAAARIQEALGDYVINPGRRPGVRSGGVPRATGASRAKAKADVVFGSRFLGGGPHRVLLLLAFVGNWLLTLMSNVLRT